MDKAEKQNIEKFKGFSVPAFTDIPNVVIASLRNIPDADLRVYLVVMRKTIGYMRNEALIPASVLSEVTGCNLDSVYHAIARLKINGLIRVSEDVPGDPETYRYTPVVYYEHD
jgi:hypothetical protein